MGPRCARAAAAWRATRRPGKLQWLKIPLFGRLFKLCQAVFKLFSSFFRVISSWFHSWFLFIPSFHSDPIDPAVSRSPHVLVNSPCSAADLQCSKAHSCSSQPRRPQIRGLREKNSYYNLQRHKK